MSFELIVARYGLLAVGLGSAIEGETSVVTGGLLAHEGLLPLSGVVAAAICGSFLSDQCYFLIGRHFRQSAFVRGLLARPMAKRALTLLERYPDRFIFAARFLYGLRTLSPIAVGTSHISHARFLVLNLISATVWGLSFALIGYKVGDELADVFHRVHPLIHVLLVGVPGVLGGILVLRWLMIRYHRRAMGACKQSLDDRPILP